MMNCDNARHSSSTCTEGFTMPSLGKTSDSFLSHMKLAFGDFGEDGGTSDSELKRDVISWLNPESPSEIKMDSIDNVRDFERTESSYMHNERYSDITDPANSLESPPDSRLPSEADLANMYWQDSPDMISSQEQFRENTYFVSKADSPHWTITGDNCPADHNHPLSISPAFTATGSRDSPIGTDVSFYEDAHKPPVPDDLHFVPVRGRATPPPPYRPPIRQTPEILVDTNCWDDFQYLHLNLDLLPPKIGGRLTPPPPYQRAARSPSVLETPQTCNTNLNSTSSGPRDFQFSPSASSPATADRTRSPAHVTWDASMPASPPADGKSAPEPRNCSTRNVDEDGKEVFVPADPEQWEEEHIIQWLKWIENQFLTGQIDGTGLPANGVSLCQLTKEDFVRITGDNKVAEILISHLTHLRRASGHTSSPISISVGSEIIKSENNFLGSLKEILGEICSENEKNSLSTSGGGQIQLWQFLIYLLAQPGNESLIALEGDEGQFRLIDPEGVARKWGERKSKPNMNYDKLSRALRYYYDKGILTKVNGRRYTYKFEVEGIRRAIHPTGLSDTYLIQPGFEVCNYNTVRNFNFQNLQNTSLDVSPTATPSPETSTYFAC